MEEEREEKEGNYNDDNVRKEKSAGLSISAHEEGRRMCWFYLRCRRYTKE